RDGDFVLLAGPVVGDRQGVLGHTSLQEAVPGGRAAKIAPPGQPAKWGPRPVPVHSALTLPVVDFPLMPAPDLASRARGALLGFAAGNVLGVPTEFLHTPDLIQARFPGGVRDVVREDTPDSPYDDDLALTLILAEELLEPAVDLHRLALRWADWAERDGR